MCKHLQSAPLPTYLPTYLPIKGFPSWGGEGGRWTMVWEISMEQTNLINRWICAIGTIRDYYKTLFRYVDGKKKEKRSSVLPVYLQVCHPSDWFIFEPFHLA